MGEQGPTFTGIYKQHSGKNMHKDTRSVADLRRRQTRVRHSAGLEDAVGPARDRVYKYNKSINDNHHSSAAVHAQEDGLEVGEVATRVVRERAADGQRVHLQHEISRYGTQNAYRDT